MQVSVLSVQKLFDRAVHYQVPLYQRPYVWNESDQWRPLWADLQALAEALASGGLGRAHFMGATVQDNLRVPAGATETRRIIDGQQRMTTLQLLLKAFRDALKKRGIAQYPDAVGKLLFNDDPLITEEEKKFKICPTRTDQDDFGKVMYGASPEDILSLLGRPAARYPLKNHIIVDAYLFFYAQIDAWLGEDEASIDIRVKALYGAIRDQLRLVVIDLDDKDDAQAIFETLNARGAPLLSADLVKNYLLGQLLQGETEPAYQIYWRDFDHDGAFWRQLVGRGHAQRARIETFLQHALTLMTKETVSVGHLYNAYRDFAESPMAAPAMDQLKRLHRLGQIYKRLHQPQSDRRLADFYRRLEILDVVTAWPFIMALHEQCDPSVIKDVLLDIESFLVRRMICRLSSRNYGKLFAHLTAALVQASASPVEAVRNALLAGDAEIDRWPSDAEFETAWMEFPLYRNLTRPRVRMLLEALEEAQRSDFSEEMQVQKDLTIEHVMPQGWREAWPLSEGASEDVRDRIIHTMGNLTLLTGKFNTHQSNRPWGGESDSQGKRSKLEEHTVLCLNRSICKNPHWEEKQIAERGRALVQVARNIWPRPDGP